MFILKSLRSEIFGNRRHSLTGHLSRGSRVENSFVRALPPCRLALGSTHGKPWHRLQEGAAQGARGRSGGGHQAVSAGGAARAEAAGARHATAGGLAARARLQRVARLAQSVLIFLSCKAITHTVLLPVYNNTSFDILFQFFISNVFVWYVHT